ncbi:bifunctional riboflavin kinase/FAD synthetase [Canibacter sp. lx-72]|nr:bifunctional riboflavin kinase/FAD synthetase [Canibacter zhuwentaonis]MBT1018195.1 bifunctional riboflavin kinase/FAD synthetase [Canibacter zhuwentaonis]MBT1035206.1 bifunctional riboflavin kinase/FAD synthetase [Canibacter zhuwentaonis]
MPQDAFTSATAVAIGKFDGLHLGHRKIITELINTARQRDYEPCVFTFTDNPLATLAPEKCPRALASTEQRIELLAKAGVSATLMVDFTRELARLEPAEFVYRVLLQGMNAREILVGHDFKFGKNGSGDVQLLRELGQQHGFAVRVLSDIEIDGERVSSTRIRELLERADVTGAAKLLGRTQSVRGLVVHGAARGRTLGFPTANMQPKYAGLAPADGVYAGYATVAGETYAAAISIGGNPTFTPDAPSQIEVHLLDFSGNIYGELMTLQFVAHLRMMTAYRGIDALVAQISEDVVNTRRIIAPILDGLADQPQAAK